MKGRSPASRHPPSISAVPLIVAALLALPGTALAQAPSRPSVHVVATGGTIASSAQGTIGVDRLIAAVPALERVADLTFEQVLRTGSSRIGRGDLLDLARAVDGQLKARPDLAGVVVTHGTDSMEETAYFLDLVIDSDRPVVVTGAMRSADAVGADGPANLLGAVRLAAHPDARGRGTLVLMNDEIHRARDVAKTNTLRVDAFESPVVGAVGVIDGDGPVFLRPPGARAPRFDVAGVDELPQVEVDVSYVGAPGTGIRAAIRGGTGVVIAGFGSGRVSQGQAAAVAEALEAGLPVVMSSRVGSGRVEDAYGGGLGAAGRGVILAEDLNPWKARILLMVALTRTRDPSELARVFRSY